MNRALRMALVTTAVLLSGTVAFAVAATTAPPGVDGVRVVITDRPVLSVTAATTRVPVATDAAGATTPGSIGAFRAKSPSSETRTVVTGVGPGTRPKVIVVPAVKPKPPTVSDDAKTDHEVVTPPVRDDDDDDDHDSDDDHKHDSSSPSSDHHHSWDTTRLSGSKGD